ncbi:centrosomal protein of 126 kDa [Diretmus argenteus]
MQVLKDNFFYHSNSRLGADGGFEDERQLLVEEQRLCRARTRKFSQETNRRRKALEDRRKQWDVQEQRLRENILQQRRQRVQDATERFQRAHLPPPQRRRYSFRKKVPNIEDALNDIQSTLYSYTRQSSFLSSNSNISRSCTPSPKPPTASKPSHLRDFYAIEAYTKLLQEHSMPSVRNSQQLFVNELQETREREQDTCSPQEHRVYHLNDSESLSSLDSLENEDPDHSNLQCSYSSLLHAKEKPQPLQRNKNDERPAFKLSSSSTTILLSDNLPQPRKMHTCPKPKKQEESELLNNRMHNPSQATRGFTSTEHAADKEARPPLGYCSLLTLCEIIDAKHCEERSPGSSPGGRIAVVTNNKVAPGNTALEFSRLKQEAQLDLRQQNVHDDRHSKHPSATEILLPAKNDNHKDFLFEASLKPNIFLKYSTTGNASKEETTPQTGKETNFLPSWNKSSDSINNLNKVSNSVPKAEKCTNTQSLQHACPSNIKSDSHKGLEGLEEGIQKSPLSAGASHSVGEVRFIKGILKKQSKYASGDSTAVHGAGQLIFAKQVAYSVRDSVELTKAKAKDAEGSKTVKKKLRWFDEINPEKEYYTEQNINTRKQSQKSKASNLSQSKNNIEDHQLSLTTVSGASRSGPGATPPASAGDHFTKQAWADVGVQVSMLQEQGDEVKVPRSSARTGGPKVPRRERSARAGAGPVSSRARKGTVMRPQSATEVSQIAKTQGKIMVPRPPPKMETGGGDTGDKTAHIPRTPCSGDHSKQALPVERASHKDGPEGFLSPYTHHVIRTGSSVMYTPLPPSYTCPVSEGNTKGTASSGLQETQGCCGRRGLVYNETGLCLDCTPTDEEISQLWHGVRSALATKDAHALVRRPGAPESGGVRRKSCVEPSRQPAGSGNTRFPSQVHACRAVWSRADSLLAQGTQGSPLRYMYEELCGAEWEHKVPPALSDSLLAQGTQGSPLRYMYEELCGAEQTACWLRGHKVPPALSGTCMKSCVEPGGNTRFPLPSQVHACRAVWSQVGTQGSPCPLRYMHEELCGARWEHKVPPALSGTCMKSCVEPGGNTRFPLPSQVGTQGSPGPLRYMHEELCGARWEHKVPPALSGTCMKSCVEPGGNTRYMHVELCGAEWEHKVPLSGTCMKSCVEPGGNTRFPRPSQTTDSAPPFPTTYDTALPDEGSEFHLADVHGERDILVAMETAQTQRPGPARQQPQGLTTISMEEKKILLSLDRLDQQLHCVQDHAAMGNTALRGLVHVDTPSVTEGKVTIKHKHRTFAADSRSGSQRKF